MVKVPMSFPEEQLGSSPEPIWGEEPMFKSPLKNNFPEDQPGGATKAACGEERVEKASFPKEPPGGTTEHTWTRTASDSEDLTNSVKMPLSGGRKVQKTAASYHRMEEQTGGPQETDR